MFTEWVGKLLPLPSFLIIKIESKLLPSPPPSVFLVTYLLIFCEPK